MHVLLVATVSPIHMGPFWNDAGQRRRLFQRLAQRVAVKRIAVQCVGMEDEHPTFSSTVGRSDGGLAAELIRCAGLSFTYALHLGGMPLIDLRFGAAVQGLLPDDACLS